MRKTLKTLIVISAVVAGIAVAPALYAQSTENTPRPQVPLMGQGNMMGMMGQMMETHTKMMQSMMDAHGSAAPGATPSDKE